MRSSTLDRRLVAGVLVLFLIPTLLVGGILFFLYWHGLYANNPSALALTVGIGFVFMMAYLGAVAYGIGRSLVGSLRQIQLGTELMATVNPDHRLEVRTGDELEALAEEINRMADRVGEARTELEREVAQATSELELERSKLSAVLEALGEGVVLATPQGRISLANRAAQELLSSRLLGRSLFDFFDRDKVGHFQERLQSGPGVPGGSQVREGSYLPAERFTLQPAGGGVYETVMTPYYDAEQRMIGLILVLRDVTLPVRSDEERRQLLVDAVRELRGPLASIRSLSESLVSESGGSEEPTRRLLEAIHAEAVRLSSLVAGIGESARLGLGRPPEHFEQISVADLTFLVLRRLVRRDGGAEALEIEGPVPSLTRLGAEVSALSGALASLVLAAFARRELGSSVMLRPVLRGRVLQMEVGAAGNVAVAELEGLLDEPIGAGLKRARSTVGPRPEPTVREVVRQHAGEAWAYAGEGRFGFRVTLPTIQPPDELAANDAVVAREDHFVGAGTVSGWDGGADSPTRPEFYDFSLFEQMDRQVSSADMDRPLDELTYVVLDTETTGLEPEAGDRIVSLAGIKIRAGSVRRAETFDALVNPRRRIPKASIRFHGITHEMVAEAPTIETVLPAFLHFAEGAVLVGHEVSFDLRFLNGEAERLGLPLPSATYAALDTLVLSELVHGPLEGHRLETVAGRLGVTVRGRHSALGDAVTTAEIFVLLLELLKKRDIRTLRQALEASQRTRGGRMLNLPAEPTA